MYHNLFRSGFFLHIKWWHRCNMERIHKKGMMRVEVRLSQKDCMQNEGCEKSFSECLGKQGRTEESLVQRLPTWQYGAQEARNLCLPQAICGLGSGNGGSLIQTFFLSLWKNITNMEKLISWLKGLTDYLKHQLSLLMPTWHRLQVTLQNKTKVLKHFPITSGELQGVPFKICRHAELFRHHSVGMLSWWYQAAFLLLELC